MSSNEARKRLLMEYAVALVAEHAAWDRLRDPQLSETERLECVATWKMAGIRLKLLAQQVRASSTAAEFGSHQAGDCGPEPSLMRRGLALARHLMAGVVALAAHCRDFARAAAARLAA